MAPHLLPVVRVVPRRHRRFEGSQRAVQAGLDRAARPAEHRRGLRLVEVEQVAAGHDLAVLGRERAEATHQLGRGARCPASRRPGRRSPAAAPPAPRHAARGPPGGRPSGAGCASRWPRSAAATAGRHAPSRKRPRAAYDLTNASCTTSSASGPAPRRVAVRTAAGHDGAPGRRTRRRHRRARGPGSRRRRRSRCPVLRSHPCLHRRDAPGSGRHVGGADSGAAPMSSGPGGRLPLDGPVHRRPEMPATTAEPTDVAMSSSPAGGEPTASWRRPVSTGASCSRTATGCSARSTTPRTWSRRPTCARGGPTTGSRAAPRCAPGSTGSPPTHA